MLEALGFGFLGSVMFLSWFFIHLKHLFDLCTGNSEPRTLNPEQHYAEL